MAEVLAWPLLYDGVVAFFADEEIAIVNQFGWSAPTRQPGGALAKVVATSPRRIVWVPGDDANGNAGKMLGPINPGRMPEPPLDTLDEVFTLYFVGVDSSDTADERKQYTAARLVFDQWRRAMHYAAYGDADSGGRFAVLALSWKTDVVKLKQRGAALRALVTVQAMIPDVPDYEVQTDAAALLQGQLETGTTEPTDAEPSAPHFEDDGEPVLIPADAVIPPLPEEDP